MAKKLLRSGIEKLKPYEPGRPIEEVQREFGLDDVIKLASNESPYPPFPKAIEAMQAAMAEVNRYPDDNATYLKEKLSAFLGAPVENVIVGHGSNELIRLLVEVVMEPGDEAIMADPSFVVYPRAVAVSGGTAVRVPTKDGKHDLDAMLNAVTERTKIVFICNPNNPTGTIVSKEELEKFLEKIDKEILVVLDEAYFEFVTDSIYPNGLDYFDGNRPLVVLRTFSKIYGLAGCRIGYGVAPRFLVDAVNSVRDAFNTGADGQVGAMASIDCQEEVKDRRRLNAEGREYLMGEFERLGFPYLPSQTNFIMLDVGDEGRIVTHELMRVGVIVRPGPFPGHSGWIRVSVGTPEENRRFISALVDVVSKIKAGKA